MNSALHTQAIRDQNKNIHANRMCCSILSDGMTNATVNLFMIAPKIKC